MNKGAIRTEMEEGRKEGRVIWEGWGFFLGGGGGGGQVPQRGLVIPAAPFGARHGRHFYFRRSE